MQRRIEQTHGYRTTCHCLENTFEVLLLVRQDLCQCILTPFRIFRQDHFTHSLDFFTFEEHMFRAAQTNTYSTEIACDRSIVRSIGIRANLQLRIFICQSHQFGKITGQFGSLRLYLSDINRTGRTVYRNIVAFFQLNTIDFYSLILIIDFQSSGTRYAAFTHTACNNGSMRSHTATSSQNTFSNSHTSQVLRGCFDTDHYDLLSVSMPFGRIIGEEHDLPCCRSRRCRQAFHPNFRLFLGHLVEYRVKQFIQFIRFDTFQCCLLVNHTLMQQVDCDFNHCSTGTFSVTGLQEPQFSFLHGEFHILHIMIMVFQLCLQFVQLPIDFRHGFFH